MQSIETFDLIIRNNYSFQFCLLDVCGQSVIRGSEKLFIGLLSNGRGSFDYTRNVDRILVTPNRMIHHPTPSTSPRVMFEFASRGLEREFHNEEETQQTHCSCSCCVLWGPSCFSTQSRNSQPNFQQFFFSFWPLHYSININIQTKSQLILREYSKK